MNALELAALLEGALNVTGDGVLAFDTQWQFTYVSDAAEHMMMRPRVELLGFNLWDLYPELIKSPFGTAYLHAMTDGVPVQVESFYDPFQAWYEVRAVPSLTGIVVFTRDITSRKRAEAAASSPPLTRPKSSSTPPVASATAFAEVTLLCRDATRSIVRLSHCIEDELGGRMTTTALRDMALLRGCVTRLRSAVSAEDDLDGAILEGAGAHVSAVKGEPLSGTSRG